MTWGGKAGYERATERERERKEWYMGTREEEKMIDNETETNWVKKSARSPWAC